MSQALFEVVPLDGGWLLRMPGDSSAEVRPTKLDALKRFRELARGHEDWRVRVLTTTGNVEAELTSAEIPPAS